MKGNQMHVKPIGSNQTQVTKRNGTFLVSYETPVAALINGLGWIRTEKFWSVTTSKHINQWIEGEAELVSQEELDGHFGV